MFKRAVLLVSCAEFLPHRLELLVALERKMYYEETIINGVLCFRTTPNTPFVEYSKDRLTSKIKELEQKIKLQDASKAIDTDSEWFSNLMAGFSK